jgi:hypothetical protein
MLRRDHHSRDAAPGAQPGSRAENNRLIVEVPVEQAGARIGAVYLETATEPPIARVQRSRRRISAGSAENLCGMVTSRPSLLPRGRQEILLL